MKDMKKRLEIDSSLLLVTLGILVTVVFSGLTYFMARGLDEQLSGKYVLAAQSTTTGNDSQGSNALQLRTFSPPPTQPPPPVYNPPEAVVTEPPITRTSCSQTPQGCNVTQPPAPKAPAKKLDCTTEGPPPPNCCPGVNVSGRIRDPSNPVSPVDPWCDSKPVIYLYPEKPTNVSVKLSLPGYVTESVPHYPKGGWQNITAYPGGRLEYQGKTYSELYYESAVERAAPEPVKGIVASPPRYRETLIYFGTQLGLNDKELAEFVSYWMGRLSQVNSPYMFFSYYPPQDKQKIDGVGITPKPDTMIEFIMYFKPLNNLKKVQAPTFSPVPSRQGFTAVEWGGILDN